MDKVIRNGQVAVLYSPGYGAGWYSWHNDERLVFHPDLVALVEQKRHHEITEELIAEILEIDENEVPYLGGVKDLRVEWLELGTAFKISEYDGSEAIVEMTQVNWLTA